MAGKVGMEWKKIKKSSGIRYVPQNPVVLHARTRLGITGCYYAIGVVAGMKMGLCIGNGLDGRMNKEQQEFWQDLSVPPLNRRGCRNCIHFGPSGLLSFDMVTDTRIGKVFYIETDDDINDIVKHIVNPVMEDWTIEEQDG